MYFRLAPGSQVIGNHPAVWLGKLAPGAKILVLSYKLRRPKSGAATVAKVNGVVKDQDGSESSWLIENDDELTAFSTGDWRESNFCRTASWWVCVDLGLGPTAAFEIRSRVSMAEN